MHRKVSADLRLSHCQAYEFNVHHSVLKLLGKGRHWVLVVSQKFVFILHESITFFKVLLLGNVVRLSQPWEYYNV